MSVLAAIRAATAERHKELEVRLDIVERLSRKEERGPIMERYFRLYAAAEARLLPRLSAVEGLDYAGRLKTPHLRQDLETIGLPLAEPKEGVALPPLSGTSEALGFAYVLEGATLGGRVIRKQLARRGVPAAETRFFDGYGDDTGRRWSTFCAVLERDCAPAPEKAVAGAIAGFSYVAHGLLG